MTHHLAALAFAGVAMTGAAAAAELAPGSAFSVHLARTSGVIYYTVEQNGFRVVATLAAEESAPVRFISTLSPGESFAVSVPQGADQPPIDLEVKREGDVLRIGDPTPALTAAVR